MVSANQFRARLTACSCSPTVVLLVRASVMTLVLTALSATSVLAQIYVVTAADGSRRFTNEPVEGAQVFLETRYSLVAASISSRGPVPFQNEISVLWIAVGSQTHQFVLARVHLESTIIGKRRIQKS